MGKRSQKTLLGFIKRKTHREIRILSPSLKESSSNIFLKISVPIFVWLLWLIKFWLILHISSKVNKIITSSNEVKSKLKSLFLYGERSALQFHYPSAPHLFMNVFYTHWIFTKELILHLGEVSMKTKILWQLFPCCAVILLVPVLS